MFHPTLMHDLLKEARDKKIKTKIAIRRMAMGNKRYDELKEMHIDLVTKVRKNEESTCSSAR